MKRISIVILTFFCVSFSFSQGEETMSNIKDQIEVIDSYMESDVFSLDPEEFLTKMADHGAELNGYYEHERLKKIIRKIGMPTSMVITVFYFWNDELIYVDYKQRQYMERKNEEGLVVMDYANAFTKYEAKHYFDKGKDIHAEEIGVSIKDIELDEEYVEYAQRMRSLLDDKFKNRATYDMLQGKWVNVQFPEEHMIFEETIRFNFRDGRFLKRLKVKIKDDVMTCSALKDNYVYKYQIVSLNGSELVLRDLQDSSSVLSLYAKSQ